MASTVHVGPGAPGVALTDLGPAVSRSPSADLVVGVSGRKRNTSVTICAPGDVLGICEQERLTRVRGAGANSTGLPDEALDELLRRAGRSRRDVAAYVTSESEVPGGLSGVDHHFAHACAAYLPSPFDSAAVIVCDHHAPQVSVWDGDGENLTQVEWPWSGAGFAKVYSECCAAFARLTNGREPRLEALARLNPSTHDQTVARLVDGDVDGLRLQAGWQARLEDRVGNESTPDRAATVAATLQARIGDLLVALVTAVKRRLRHRTRLCLGGTLFYNSYFNSRAKSCGEFDEVFVPVNPGNAGLSVGAALRASRRPRQQVSPFLGPAYDAEEIKATLDNCKLTYDWAPEPEALEVAVGALRNGWLVALFDGAMEWGPRALGARSIVANPFHPFVLENLNKFLKRREPWRGYALSGTAAAVREHFDGPAASPYMECDFRPRDRERFRHVLPRPGAAVRVHTVSPDRPSRFGKLLQAFGAVSGVPILVNTSFNGFQEPIVCSPRDAVRVFFGTGIDVLLLGDFILRK